MIYYRVIVSTGEKGLDTEARAFVTLFGEQGETAEFQMQQKNKEVFAASRSSCHSSK